MSSLSSGTLAFGSSLFHQWLYTFIKNIDDESFRNRPFTLGWNKSNYIAGHPGIYDQAHSCIFRERYDLWKHWQFLILNQCKLCPVNEMIRWDQLTVDSIFHYSRVKKPTLRQYFERQNLWKCFRHSFIEFSAFQQNTTPHLGNVLFMQNDEPFHFVWQTLGCVPSQCCGENKPERNWCPTEMRLDEKTGGEEIQPWTWRIVVHIEPNTYVMLEQFVEVNVFVSPPPTGVYQCPILWGLGACFSSSMQVHAMHQNDRWAPEEMFLSPCMQSPPRKIRRNVFVHRRSHWESMSEGKHLCSVLYSELPFSTGMVVLTNQLILRRHGQNRILQNKCTLR